MRNVLYYISMILACGGTTQARDHARLFGGQSIHKRAENETATDQRACEKVDYFLQRTYDSLETVIGGDRAADLSNHFYSHCERYL